jgi:hypothetical protein
MKNRRVVETVSEERLNHEVTAVSKTPGRDTGEYLVASTRDRLRIYQIVRH